MAEWSIGSSLGSYPRGSLKRFDSYLRNISMPINPKHTRTIMVMAIIAMAGFIFGGCSLIYTKKQMKRLIVDAYSLGWATGYLDCNKSKKKNIQFDKNMTRRN